MIDVVIVKDKCGKHLLQLAILPRKVRQDQEGRTATGAVNMRGACQRFGMRPDRILILYN